MVTCSPAGDHVSVHSCGRGEGTKYDFHLDRVHGLFASQRHLGRTKATCKQRQSHRKLFWCAVTLPDTNRQLSTDALLHPLNLSLCSIKQTSHQSLIHLGKCLRFSCDSQQILAQRQTPRQLCVKCQFRKVPNCLCL